MSEKILKRSYNFPENLVKEWERFHFPSKDFSPSASAAFLLYMVIDPAIREKLRKLAYDPDIKKAQEETIQILKKAITDSYLTGYLNSLTVEKRTNLLEDAKKSEQRSSGKK